MHRALGLVLMMTSLLVSGNPTLARSDPEESQEFLPTVPAEVAGLSKDGNQGWVREKLDELERRLTQRSRDTPPPVKVEGDHVVMTWLDTQGSVQTWRVAMDTVNMLKQRPRPARHVLLRGESKRYRAIDFRPFVDPQPFAQLARDMRARAGSDDAYMEDVLAMVSQLTSYLQDVEEGARWPLETLVEAGGDCEDTSILIATLLVASGRPYHVDFVYFDVKNPDAAGRVNHVALHVTLPGGTRRLVESTAKIGDRNYIRMPLVAGWYVGM